MNYKGILFFLGIYSLFVSFFSFLNILYAIYFDFILDIDSYLLTLIISITFGVSFCFLGRNNKNNMTLSDQLGFIVLSFMFIPLLVSLPYFLSIYNINFINAYFESVSGITGTGFSILQNIENINEPLLLWRSSSQWLGGLFFLIAIIGTIGSKQIKIKPAYMVSGGTLGSNFYNNFNSNFIRILFIYFISTIFVIFLYSLTGLRLLDSLNLALTTISSGGFIHKESLSNIIINNTQTLVLSLTLLFPIFNFYLFFNIFTKKFRFKKHQEDLHLILLIILISLIFYFFIIPTESFFSVILAVTSSIATSGISIYSSNFDISLFFILLTIVGGSLMSTSSGFKYVRFYILLKISYQEICKLVKPINVYNKNLFNTETKIEDDESKIAFLAFILFIASFFVLSSVLTLDDLTFESSIKLSILTLTNTTNSFLYGLDNLSFFELEFLTKFLLVIFMILGRIEIITLLFLTRKFIFKE